MMLLAARKESDGGIPLDIALTQAVSDQKSSCRSMRGWIKMGTNKPQRINMICDTNLAEGEGFEPPVSCPTTVFKTAAFNRSANPPETAWMIPLWNETGLETFTLLTYSEPLTR